jgi:glutamate N-acetyltransferase/amino-acid N-acetyltransferase
MNPDKAACKVGPITVFKNGRPTEADLSAVERVMKEKDLAIGVDLGMGGKGTHRVYTCDLSREYIAINADYHT